MIVVRGGVKLISEASHACCITENALLVFGPDLSDVELFTKLIYCRLHYYGGLFYLMSPNIPLFGMGYGKTSAYWVPVSSSVGCSVIFHLF